MTSGRNRNFDGKIRHPVKTMHLRYAAFLLFCAAAVAQTPVLTLSSATIQIDPQDTDSYSIQGGFNGLSFTSAQAVVFTLGQFSGTIPIAQFVRQPGANVLTYQDSTGLTPYWISSLSLDLDAQTFAAQAAGIVLAGLPNPFSVTLGTDQAFGCAMTRVQGLGSGSYQLTPGDGVAEPCLIPSAPAVEPIFAGTPAPVTFNVEISPGAAVDPQSFRLYRADDNAQPLGDALCALSDQGGGVYSCSVLFNEPATGAIPLLVQASAGSQTILSPGFALLIVRSGEDRDMQQISDIQDVMSGWQANFDQFGDSPHARTLTLAALRALLAPQPSLSAQPVGLAPDGLSIGARADFGGVMMMPLNRLETAPDNSGSAQAKPIRIPRSSRKDAPLSTILKNAELPAPQCGEHARDIVKNDKVLIWNPAYIFLDGVDGNYGPQLSKAKCPKFEDPVVLNGTDADLRSLDRFPEFGTIMMTTHGGPQILTNRGSALTGDRNLRPILTDPIHYEISCETYYPDPKNAPLSSAFGCFLAVLAGNSHLQALNNTIIFGGFCFSDLLSNSFAPANSKSAFFGYSNITTLADNRRDGSVIFDSLVNQYNSAAEAIDGYAPYTTIKLRNKPNLAYVGNPRLISPQGVSQSYVVGPNGLLNLQAHLDGTSSCDGVMNYHWMNSARVGHLTPLSFGSGQDDYMGLDSGAKYMAGSSASGRTDQIKVDFAPDLNNPIAAEACATIGPGSVVVSLVREELQVNNSFIVNQETPNTGAPYQSKGNDDGFGNLHSSVTQNNLTWTLEVKGQGYLQSGNPPTAHIANDELELHVDFPAPAGQVNTIKYSGLSASGLCGVSAHAEATDQSDKPVGTTLDIRNGMAGSISGSSFIGVGAVRAFIAIGISVPAPTTPGPNPCDAKGTLTLSTAP